jgi:dTMP kinase
LLTVSDLILPARMFLVAIEGVDGAGKTTQAELLRASVAATGRDVKLRSFPAYDSFMGRQIRQMLRDSAPLDARSAALWFAVDRQQALAHDPLAADVEICNRYTLSNAVYQSSRAPEDETVYAWVLELERELGIPAPDLTFVLDVTPALVAERTAARAELDAYERQRDLQNRVRARYLAADDVVVIACDGRTPEEIGADLEAALRERL